VWQRDLVLKFLIKVLNNKIVVEIVIELKVIVIESKNTNRYPIPFINKIIIELKAVRLLNKDLVLCTGQRMEQSI
jgi:hypothetical protein